MVQAGFFNGAGGSWWEQQFWGGGQLLGHYDGSTTYFIHRSDVGSSSPTQITTGSGSLSGDETFYPWGQQWEYDNEANGWWQFYGGISRYQADLNLYLTPHRFYSSSYGRWLTPDKLGGSVLNPQSLNRYAYALNNPETLNDPSGLSPCFGQANCESFGQNYANHEAFCGPNNCEGGFSVNTNPGDNCAYLSSLGDASCGSLPGLWDNGQPINWPGLGSAGGGGGEGGGGAIGGGGTAAGAAPAGQPTLGGMGNALQPYPTPIIFNWPWAIHVTTWGWPYIRVALQDSVPLLGAINPWSPQAQALKASVNNPKGTPNEPQTPLQQVEDTRRPPTWEESIDQQWQAILDALAGVARGSIIPDVGVGPIVDPRVIVPQSPQVPQGGVY